LDSALLRPGRIDRKVQYNLATKEQASALYLRFFRESQKTPPILPNTNLNTSTTSDFGTEKPPLPLPSPHTLLASLSTSFAAQIPMHTFSTAELQGYLLSHKHDPAAAVDNVAGWVEKEERERREREEREEKRKRKVRERRWGAGNGAGNGVGNGMGNGMGMGMGGGMGRGGGMRRVGGGIGMPFGGGPELVDDVVDMGMKMDAPGRPALPLSSPSPTPTYVNAGDVPVEVGVQPGLKVVVADSDAGSDGPSTLTSPF
jgi:mitochondrial chaperone BCS1